MADQPETKAQGGFRLLRLAGQPREEVELPSGPVIGCKSPGHDSQGNSVAGACSANVILGRNGLPRVDMPKSEECERVARGIEGLPDASRKYLGRRFTYDGKPLAGKKRKVP